MVPTRLSLIGHARTDALRQARFPGDEEVDASGFRDLARARERGGWGEPDRVLVAPERRTRTTADELGIRGEITTALADVSYGSWAGEGLGDLADADMAAWLTDTSTTPPGGESVDAVVGRVRAWMADVSTSQSRILAVTHPAVIRAVVICALDAPPQSFWRIDVPPLTLTTANCTGGRWTLRTLSGDLGRTG